MEAVVQARDKLLSALAALAAHLGQPWTPPPRLVGQGVTGNRCVTAGGQPRPLSPCHQTYPLTNSSLQAVPDPLASLDEVVTTAYEWLQQCDSGEPLPGRVVAPLCEPVLELLPGSLAALWGDECSQAQVPIHPWVHTPSRLLLSTLLLMSRLTLTAGGAASARQWTRALQQLRYALDAALLLLGLSGDGGWADVSIPYMSMTAFCACAWAAATCTGCLPDACCLVCPAPHHTLPPLPPCLLAVIMQVALLGPWLQTLNCLHDKCPAGVRPLLSLSVADPAFSYALKIALLVWGCRGCRGPEQPAGAAISRVQQYWNYAAGEVAELLVRYSHHRSMPPWEAQEPLSPPLKEQCQRLLGFAREVGLPLTGDTARGSSGRAGSRAWWTLQSWLSCAAIKACHLAACCPW